ncbi:hypothetical protein [Staphylococcus sp. FSL W8-0774]|uniref:hypothetical protein n=1 Tax=Staphylococcus sp. FSL W8-0774 TaxID=2954632 RepID=UPI0030F614CE
MNTLNHITKVKIYEIQTFLDIPRKLSPLETLHIAFQPHNVNLIYNNMGKDEQTYIENLLKDASSTVNVNEDIKTTCKLTNQLGFFYKESTDEYIIDPIYLNKVNEYVFTGLYEYKDLDNDNKQLLKEFKKLDEKVRYNIEHTNLKDYLTTLKAKDIQNILKFYEFKNTSKLKKADAVKLINDTFFENNELLERVFNQFTNSTLFIFQSIYENDKNYTSNIDIASTVNDVQELTSPSQLFNYSFIFNYNARYNIVSIPYDALDFIDKYIQSTGGLESVIDDQIERIGTQKDNIFESLAEHSLISEIEDDLTGWDSLGDFDSLADSEDNFTENDIIEAFEENNPDNQDELDNSTLESVNIENYMDPEIRQNLVQEQLKHFKNDPKKQHYVTPLNIYIAITNLYGYASLERVSYLMKHLYNKEMTQNDIKDEIKDMDINRLVTIQNDMLLHPVIPLLTNSSDIDDPFKAFYVPDNLDELLTYVNNEYYGRNTKLKQFIKFIRNNIKANDDIEKEKAVQYILFHLRIAPDEEHAVEMMNNLFKEDKILPVPDKTLSKQIEKGWTHLRLWSTRGFTVQEILNSTK